jgi:hypothetical protein
MAGRSAAIEGHSVGLAEKQAVAFEVMQDCVVGLLGPLACIDVTRHPIAMGVQEAPHARGATDRKGEIAWRQ